MTSMLTRTHITVLLGTAVVVWASALLVFHLPVTWEYTKPFAFTVSALSVACIVFEKWLWKWRLFRGWLVNRPDVQGTWRARLISTAASDTDKPAPNDWVMVIRQTFSTLSARLYTRESTSFLLAHNLVRHSDGIFQIVAVDQNTPDVLLRGDRSEIHNGAMLLEVRGDPPTTLTGHYWTDRRTKAKIELSNRIPDLLASYEDGAAHYKLFTNAPTNSRWQPCNISGSTNRAYRCFWKPTKVSRMRVRPAKLACRIVHRAIPQRKQLRQL
jgi:hypothetical protein